MTIEYKTDFSFQAIVYMIQILRNEQRSKTLNTKTDICRALNVTRGHPTINLVFDILEKEKCFKYEYLGRDKYLMFNLSQLRGTIDLQTKIEEFRYFFIKEV